MSLHASFSSGGRGLVFTAGNDQARLLLTVIPSIRQLGCELPIEILYLGEEDLGDEMRDKLERIPGVVTRDLALMIDDQGWQLKGMSLPVSSSPTSIRADHLQDGPQRRSRS